MQPAKSPSTPLTVSPAQGVVDLKRQRDAGNALLQNRPIDKGAFDSWENIAREYLMRAFGSESPNVASVIDIGKNTAFALGPNTGPEYWEQRRARFLAEKLTMLDGLIELLERDAQQAIPAAIVSTTPKRSFAHYQILCTIYRVYFLHGN
jgi:hypothetical protein